MTYRVWGVRCQKLKPHKSTGHKIRHAEPKVHIIIYRRVDKIWVKACTFNNISSGYMPRGDIVPDDTEVTCILCLQTNYDKPIKSFLPKSDKNRTVNDG